MTALNTAREYTRRGWRCVPISHREKGPKLPGWQELRIDDCDLPNYFNGAPQNVGVQLGAPSGGLIDVDLDHHEARRLADEYLPATCAIFGRASSPRSHRLYRVAGELKTERHRLRDGGVIVECRGTGSQTVFPGSTHPSGEAIEWDVDGEPETVEAAALLAAVRRLALRVKLDAGEDLASPTVVPATRPATVPSHVDTAKLAERGAKYISHITAISGQEGHNSTIIAASALVNGMGIAPEVALNLLRQWNQTNAQPPWSDRELQHKISEVVKIGPPQGKPQFWLRDAERDEYRADDFAFADLDGEDAAQANTETNNATESPNRQRPFSNAKGSRPLPIGDVIDELARRTNGEPYRVGSALFASNPLGGVDWLTGTASLFGWIGRRLGVSRWKRGTGFTTKEEFDAELRRTAKDFDGVEALPHVPELARHFYTWRQTAGGDGRALQSLLDRFAPATDIDRDLILSLFATVVWGGPGGSRPAFVITSDAGRGAGKSSLAKILGIIGGGLMDFSQADSGEAIKSRLLSPDGQAIRVALLDNVKSHRFSWAELEALVTAATISGKRLYVGEARRPNTLVWVLTLNGASLSTDLSQRCVIIKLAKPSRSATWEDEVIRFATDNREAILGDLVAFLKTPAAPLARYSRWATWEAAVLARLPEPSEAQAIIAERQAAADVEAEEMATVEEHFADRLARLGYDPATEAVHIPNQAAAIWWREATGEPKSPTGVTRIINQLHSEGSLKRLMVNPSRTHGRGMVWRPEGPITGTNYDLSERLQAYSVYPNHED